MRCELPPARGREMVVGCPGSLNPSLAGEKTGHWDGTPGEGGGVGRRREKKKNVRDGNEETEHCVYSVNTENQEKFVNAHYVIIW